MTCQTSGSAPTRTGNFAFGERNFTIKLQTHAGNSRHPNYVKKPARRPVLDACFDVFGLLAIPVAEFLQLNFTLDALAVFAGIVVVSLADAAAQLDKFFLLRHDVARIWQNGLKIKFFSCAEGPARTGDPSLFRRMLYQLSYLGRRFPNTLGLGSR